MAMLRMGALLAAALVLLAGCRAKIASGQANWVGLPSRGPIVFDVSFPSDMCHGMPASWTVSFIGGGSTVTIAMDLGGGALDDVPAGTPAVSPFTHEFVMVCDSSESEAYYTYTVTITDGTGMTGSQCGTYVVYRDASSILDQADDTAYDDSYDSFFGPDCEDESRYEPHPPRFVVEPAYHEIARELTVVVADDDGDPLTVSVSVPDGFVVDEESKATPPGGGELVFRWDAADVHAGAAGETWVTAKDPGRREATAGPVLMSIPDLASLVGIEVPIPEGALAAIPLRRTALVGEPVSILVYSGGFSPDAPFAFCDGVGMTVNEGAHYVPHSFNVGTLGGEANAPDGIWVLMHPWPRGFIMPPDFMMGVWPTETPGVARADFNVTPLGGRDTPLGGALFNFQLEFDHPGTYTLGFQLFENVRRTYYSEDSSDTHDWLDISNDHEGIPNTITVT